MKKRNIIIIGSGPAGTSAAIYNARASLSPLVIAGPTPGGQPGLTTHVENYPGFESIMGPELIKKFRSHAEKYGAEYLSRNVEELILENGKKAVKLDNGDEIEAKAIIIATGASALWLGLESEERLKGKGVSACATCDGFFFKDQTVAIVGGGDTAMEEALVMTKFAKKVYIIHRREKFRASKIMQKRVLENDKIEVIWDAEVEEVLGKERVTGIKLKESSKTSGKYEIPAKLDLEGMFVAIGHKPNTAFLKDSKVKIGPMGYVYTSQRFAFEHFAELDKTVSKDDFDFRYRYQTSHPGVFAAGDCVDYTYRQIATASGAGVAASLEAERYLETRKGD